MANAAAKKAAAGTCFFPPFCVCEYVRFSQSFIPVLLSCAASSPLAKAQAAATYKPLLLIANGLYLVLRYFYRDTVPFSLGSDWPLLAIAGLQWYAYVGILDKATAVRKPGDTSLLGGSSLDLLAMVLVVQYGALLWSRKLYYILMLVPVWGGYALYSTFFGGGGKKGASGATSGMDAAEPDDATKEKRQKRAERRRQKWS